MKLLLPVVIAVLLTACGNPDQPPADTGASEKTRQVEAPSVTEAQPLTEPLPESISLTFPYHTQYVRIVQRDSGDYRQHILLEFLKGGVSSAAAQIGDDMIAAGFTAGDLKKRDGGGLGINFSKEGYGRVFVIVRPADNQNLQHVSSKGTIRLDFPADASESE